MNSQLIIELKNIVNYDKCTYNKLITGKIYLIQTFNKIISLFPNLGNQSYLIYIYMHLQIIIMALEFNSWSLVSIYIY